MLLCDQEMNSFLYFYTHVPATLLREALGQNLFGVADEPIHECIDPRDYSLSSNDSTAIESFSLGDVNTKTAVPSLPTYF